MNVFIIGLPCSGRTTVAKAIQNDFGYFDLLETFNGKMARLSFPSNNDRYAFYHDKMISHLQADVEYFTKHVDVENTIIDNVSSPRDFMALFDYNRDYVIFLNRIDREEDAEDYQKIGISVIRDYCFWLSSAKLLPSDRWLEYRFRMNEDDSSYFRQLISKNSVFITRSFKKVISHIEEVIGKAKHEST